MKMDDNQYWSDTGRGKCRNCRKPKSAHNRRGLCSFPPADWTELVLRYSTDEVKQVILHSRRAKKWGCDMLTDREIITKPSLYILMDEGDAHLVSAGEEAAGHQSDDIDVTSALDYRGPRDMIGAKLHIEVIPIKWFEGALDGEYVEIVMQQRHSVVSLKKIRGAK